MDPSATLLSLFASAAWIRAFEVLPGSDGRWTVRCVVEADRSADDLRGLLNERAANLAEQVDVRIVTSLSTTPDAAMSDAPAPSPALAHCPAVALPGLAELPQTLPDALRRAAKDDSAQSLVHVRADGSEKWQTFADLLGEASAVCGGLAKLGLKPGDSALLLLDRSADVLPAFWGCLLGGIRPAIAQIPPTFTGENRGLEQLCKVWRLLDGPLLITKSNLLEPVRSLAGRLDVESVRTTDIASLLTSAPANDTFAARPEDTAFFSLTSGSTGVPKCIMLTHANIIQRAHGANLLCGHRPEDVILNWLPFDHIGSISDWHLRCVLLGCRMVYAEKESVIARPLHWLDLIDKYRVTHTWAPNFAYSLVTSSLTTRPANSPAPTWDLSCVDGMLTAGESVSQTVTEPFLKELAPYGLPATAIRPAFGMAETGSGITYQVVRHDRPLKFLSVQRPGSPVPPEGPSKSEVESAGTFASLGPPIPGVGLRIVDDEQQVVPEATIGHLQVCGTAVSAGYFHNPEANRVFHADGWFETGDLGLLANGELVITGRAKESIIVRGVNYACSELEETVGGVPGIEPSFTAACAVRRPGSDREELAVFFHTATDEETPLSELLREIQQRLVRQTGVRPDFLLPVAKEAIPKTAIGKIQRLELARRFAAGEFAAVLAAVGRLQRQPDDARAAHAQPQLPQNEIEKQLAEIWKEALSLEQIDVRDNLFDLGGDSLLLTRMHVKLQDRFGPQISLVEMFNYPTIESLSGYLSRQAKPNAASPADERTAARRRKAARTNVAPAGDVAVIGMACRFPGAGNFQEFWQNLCDGVESMQFFSDEEALAAGVDPSLLANPDYVKVAPVLPDIEWFDAKFFSISARDAALMDPQQRVMLECAWETFEVAGYNPHAYAGSVGVYAGAVMNTYLVNNLCPAQAFQSPQDPSEIFTLDSMGGFKVMVANDKDYLPTRISYKLNLRGPSINVQTACSTTLVAIHMAAQSVRYGECDMALAGGVSIKVPQEAGYLYLDDMIVSPDGHCRAFDARAQGTVFGNGAGMVLLKRLDEAIADGDHIFAVIKGSAMNNDGSGKVGYLAPSQEGMANVVGDALARSGVDPRTIGFVEAHGTGTVLGDPIELGAITQAFREHTGEKEFCAVGSVKTNVGHLQIASGVAGFIKAALAIYHRQIPPTLHFHTPNPRIDFANSPFFVNKHLQDWRRGEEPLRAGVNSLGIGGTNAHVILEEAPSLKTQQQPGGTPHVLPISARSHTALRALIGRYRDALEHADDSSLADICFTAAVGRAHFGERFAAVGSSVAELRDALAAALSTAKNGSETGAKHAKLTRVGFLFPGVGTQSLERARRLYETEPRFRQTLDRCAELLANDLPQPLLAPLFEETAPLASRPENAEPLLFAIEYALAQMWREWGVAPAALIGHGVGEYAAAAVAGVFSLDDGLRLVAARAKLERETTRREGLLAVRADEARIRELLPIVPGLSLAAINGPDQVVVAGEAEALCRFARELTSRRIAACKLPLAVRSNLSADDPAFIEFRKVVESISLSPPQTLLLSNLTGRPAGAEIATADYWCRQLLEPVRFAEGARTLAEACDCFLEVGPGGTLLELTRRLFRDDSRFQSAGCWLASLGSGTDERLAFVQSLAELYQAGLHVDWESVYADAGCRRMVLPTYPFERKRFWIERPATRPAAGSGTAGSGKKSRDAGHRSGAAKVKQSPDRERQ